MQNLKFYSFCRKTKHAELFKTKSLDTKSEAKSCQALHHQIISVESGYEDSGTFSQEARTRDWLLDQRKRTVCRSCREGKKNEEKKMKCTSHISVTCNEVNENNSVQHRTEAEISCLLNKKCSCQ